MTRLRRSRAGGNPGSRHSLDSHQRGKDAEGNIIGEFRATGIRPKFAEDMKTKGIELPTEMFAPDRALG